MARDLGLGTASGKMLELSWGWFNGTLLAVVKDSWGGRC